MHRTRLIAIACVSLAFGCKKSEPEVATKSAALEARPSELVYAASGVIRAIDWKTSRIANVEIGHPITSMVFSPAGDVAWVGTSAGLYRVEVATGAVRAELTKHPVRRLELATDGALEILEHDVIVKEDGTREILPFSLVTFDTVKLAEVAREEIGQRIHYAQDDGKHFVVVTELGEVKIGARPESLSGGHFVQLRPLVKTPGPNRLRGDVSIAARGKAYVAIEGVPAYIGVVDVATGEAEVIPLGSTLSIRGLALLPDGKTLFVNAMKHVLLVDLEKKTVRAQLELAGPHMGAALAPNAKTVYVAQTVESGGGGITAIGLEPFAIGAHVHLEDISPWAIAVAAQ